MKKILVIHNKYREIGGEDIAVQSEVSQLKKKFIVEELYFSNEIKNIFIQSLFFLINKNYISIREVKNKLKNFKPDIVYIHNTWFKVSPGIFKTLKQFDCIEVLVKLHNFRFDCTKSYFVQSHLKSDYICKACGMKNNNLWGINKYYKNSLVKSLIVLRYGKRYFKILKKFNLKILTLTEFQKSYLINLGFNQEKIFVHRNYVDVEISKKTAYNSINSYILYAGRISEEKGVELLLKAYTSLNSPSFNLKIVGNGPQFRFLSKKYSKYKQIEFLGQISNKNSKELIKNAKAVVTATNLYEGQPTLLCEASLMGIPSIFPDNGGIKEFFPNEYQLTFQNNNEQNLSDKLNKLDLIENIEEIGLENKKFLTNLIGKEAFLDSFNKVING